MSNKYVIEIYSNDLANIEFPNDFVSTPSVGDYVLSVCGITLARVRYIQHEIVKQMIDETNRDGKVESMEFERYPIVRVTLEKV